ncbi:MurR/RpiR family transcriptional regulator [Brenneria sp. g21c3]|uniref:MurR/RpiR family transcriptional regulator n=1 Tax=Brenneria sp. g21c3 TaxID=3093893 RepID=UPI002EA254B3|nr:MurR/RpiR family transcriptional regulator [Brenneria sp. g21c3]
MTTSHYLEAEVIKQVAYVAPSLPAAQRRLANYVLENAFQVASGNIENLAAATGVSIATANRFAVALGYSGYAEFRHALFQVFKPSMAPVEKLRNELGRDAPLDEVVDESLSGAQASIGQTRDHGTRSGLEQAIRMITSARNVYCFGLGTSIHLANIAAFRFSAYCQNIHALASYGGAEMALHHLQKIGEPDLLLAISFPRYSADMIRIMHFARARNASILALTDRPSSPLVGLADHTLLAAAEHQLLSSSMVAPIALIEALAAAMAHRTPEGLNSAAELTGQLLPYFYLDQPAGGAAESLDRANNQKRRRPRRKGNNAE